MWEHLARKPFALGSRGLVLLAGLALGGCGEPISTVALGLSAAGSAFSLYETDRTLYDHAISWATDKDCSLRHDLAGKPYCQEILADEARPNVACYASIGAMTCYPTENPYETESQRVQ